MSKTGARSAIAVSPMVSVVGTGAGFDLHDMVFAEAVGVAHDIPARIFHAHTTTHGDTPQIILVTTGPSSSSSSSPKLERPCFPPFAGEPIGGDTTIARSSSDA